MTLEFGDWWYKNENKIKAESLYGNRSVAICNRVDPNLEVDNIYTDVLEKFAFKYNMHLL